MSPITRLRSRSRAASALTTETVGHALVVHSPSGMTPGARALAGTLAADPEYDLVVADLPPDASGAWWEHLAAALPRSRRGIRLVVDGRTRELGALAGHWLSSRLGRTVLAPDGALLSGLNGSLFVDSGPGSGWVRFRPGQPPDWDAKRFPRPAWESRLVSEAFRAGPSSTAEPLPSGVWLRPDGDPRRLDAGRNRLTRAVPCQPEELTVVLGCRHLAPLPLEDIRTLWTKLGPEDRERVRFAHYGPVAAPDDVPLGAALANLLGQEVTCYTGLPISQSGGIEVQLLRADGSHGWSSFVQQISYPPSASGRQPSMRAYRAPFPGVDELAPAVFQYAANVVVEVVSAGLWIRTPRPPAHADAVRGLPADPAANLLLYEDTDADLTRLMWTVTQDVLARLDYSTRLVTKPLPAAAVYDAVARPAQESQDDREPVPAQETVLSADEIELRWLAELLAGEWSPEEPEVLSGQSEPASMNLAEARGRLRERWPEEFDGDPRGLRELLGTHPKLVGDESIEDVLTDAVALRRYLAGDVDDTRIRSAADAEAAAVGLCATAALERLPAHRGGTIARLAVPADQREAYRERGVITESGFQTMLAAPCASQDDGDTELLVWSMTARGTAPFEDPERGLDGRVVFAPGTAFKVLAATEADPADGAPRARLLLRELSPAEIRADGTAETNRRSLDRLAETSLTKFADKHANRDAERRVPSGMLDGVFRLPGAEPSGTRS